MSGFTETGECSADDETAEGFERDSTGLVGTRGMSGILNGLR